MGYVLIFLAVIIALILVAFIFSPDLRKTVTSSFKEGQKTGEDWAKNSAVGDIAHSLGEKVGEAHKKLKK